MAKGIVLRTFISTIVMSVLCLEPAWITIADDCQECDEKGTPTYVGNAKYSWPCKCTDATPTIDYDNDEDDLIPSAGSINLWVDSGGLACPPYTWTVDGKGWSIIDNDGDNKTDYNNEPITLSLINTTGKTCGTGGSGDYDVYATVTITDNCGKTGDIIIRYSGGKWKDYYTVNCSSSPWWWKNCYSCKDTVELVSGAYRLLPGLTFGGVSGWSPASCVKLLPATIQYGNSPTWVVTAANGCDVSYCGGWIDIPDGSNCNHREACTLLIGQNIDVWGCP